ncbi:MAG: alpha/beta hydrolase fold domain-containing protein [Alphaproteobacteria bacterium]|nr:alpha/beta hydrolase fold domain-containing protein [Alphaproteobacteria bacterium]
MMKRGATIMLALLGFALTSCVSRPPHVSVFRPEMGCAGVAPEPDNIEGAKSFTYKTASGRALRIHVFEPKDAGSGHPAVLFFFGGGWRIGSVLQFVDKANYFADRGYVTAIADYRVSCRDNSDVVQSDEDARSAYSWLRERSAEFGVDSKRMFLAGGSAGGQLALYAALKAQPGEKPLGLVLYNPAIDLRNLAKPGELKAAIAISPSDLPVKNAPAMIIMHGDADTKAPIEASRTFCARVKAAGRECQLVEYVGRDHGFWSDRKVDPHIGRSPYDDTLARTEAFLESHKQLER